MNSKITFAVFVLIIVTVLSFSFVFSSKVYADTNTVQYESVNPSDGFKYGIKRLKEKVFMTIFSFSASIFLYELVSLDFDRKTALCKRFA